MEEQLLDLLAARDLSKNVNMEDSATEEDSDSEENQKSSPQEDAPQASSKLNGSSDSRITSLENAVEKIQETQSEMPKKMEESQAALQKRMDDQDTSNASMHSILQQILSRLLPPSS